MKVIIAGGVAGGASCAARFCRLDEKAEILMVERGPYVSYVNCGLPYHIGDIIEVEKLEGVVNISLGQVRSSSNGLSKYKEINVICRSGQRAYIATRILLQNGFKAKTVSGGMLGLAHNYLFEGN